VEIIFRLQIFNLGVLPRSNGNTVYRYESNITEKEKNTSAKLYSCLDTQFVVKNQTYSHKARYAEARKWKFWKYGHKHKRMITEL